LGSTWEALGKHLGSSICIHSGRCLIIDEGGFVTLTRKNKDL
jgi:hypothetical protein